MVHATPNSFLLEQRTASVRALSSLTRRDAAAVHATVRAAGSSHAVEEHDDYDGYLSLLVTALDPSHRSFVVTGRTNAVELAILADDDMTAIGAFASIGAAMITLRPLLATSALEVTACAASITSMAVDLLERHGKDADLHAALRADADDAFKPVLRAVDLLKKLPWLE